jgi:hypothetical protein
MNVNICLGRRAGVAPSQRTSAEERAPAQWRGEDAPVPDLVARGDQVGKPEQEAPGFSWQLELTEQPLRRAGERQTRPHRMTPAARPDYDPRVVGDACRSVLRDGQASSDSAGTPEWEGEDDRSDGAHGSAPPKPGRLAEPWWRAQISQQMDHARLESTERQRRQRIATVLADNEQHRRVAQQQAYAMEDEQERVRRRAFAKIVLDEEQHSRVCEDHGADMRDIADRNRRRRWAIKALREEEARMTMVRALHVLLEAYCLSQVYGCAWQRQCRGWCLGFLRPQESARRVSGLCTRACCQCCTRACFQCAPCSTRVPQRHSLRIPSTYAGTRGGAHRSDWS